MPNDLPPGRPLAKPHLLGRPTHRTVAIALGVLLGAGTAAAQYEPLVDHSHDLDVFVGPVIASSRATSMGGAYAGLAEGVEGLFFNPAAAGNRDPFAVEWLDLDLDIGLLFPNAVGESDMANDGRPGDYDYAATGTLGAALQLGLFGVGFEWSVLQYELVVNGRPRDVRLAVRHVDMAYGFFDGQLVVGLGLRSADYQLAVYEEREEGMVREVVGTLFGPGLEGGVLWRPHGRRYRVGLAGSLPVEGDRNPLLDRIEHEAPGQNPCLSSTRVEPPGLYVPCRLVVPWRVSFGASYGFGARTNVRWVNPHDVTDEVGGRREATYATRSRRYLLVSAAFTVTGPSPDAIGVESFLGQVSQHSGRHSTVAPAVGIESEVWPNRLRLRAGSYLEPARLEDTEPRPHVTLGTDVRVFDWDGFGVVSPKSFRMGAMVDAGRQYLNFSILSFGTWH